MRKEDQFPLHQLQHVVLLRDEYGLTWAQIAQRFGYPHSRGLSLGRLVQATLAHATTPAERLKLLADLAATQPATKHVFAASDGVHTRHDARAYSR